MEEKLSKGSDGKEEEKTEIRQPKLSQSEREAKLFKRKNTTVFSESYEKMREHEEGESDDEILVPKSQVKLHKKFESEDEDSLSESSDSSDEEEQKEDTKEKTTNKRKAEELKESNISKIPKIDPTNLTPEELALQILKNRNNF